MLGSAGKKKPDTKIYHHSYPLFSALFVPTCMCRGEYVLADSDDRQRQRRGDTTAYSHTTAALLYNKQTLQSCLKLCTLNVRHKYLFWFDYHKMDFLNTTLNGLL